MSGTFPSSPAPRLVTIRSFSPTFVSVAHSQKRQTRSRGAHQWTIRMRFSEMIRDDFATIFAFLAAQRGQYDSFQWVMPNPIYTPRGVGAVGSPSPYVNNTTGSPTENQMGSTIVTSGWEASTTVLKAGDFLKFGSHSKVYMQTTDVDSNGAGLATLTLNCPVLQTLAQGDQIITANVPFTLALAVDDISFDIAPGQIFGPMDFDFVEAF